MAGNIPVLDQLIDNLRRLPGIGYKSAVRLAFYIVNSSEDYAKQFAQSIIDVKQKLTLCSVCQNISDTEVCRVCGNPSRDHSLVCVVESPRDVMTFERVKEYSGTYHVLHGVISPLDGIGPDQLKIKELVGRIGGGEVKEIIVATNPNVEGEATALYISKLIKPLGVRVTRLAYGIPVGGELEFSDEVTLFRAIEGRREI